MKKFPLTRSLVAHRASPCEAPSAWRRRLCLGLPLTSALGVGGGALVSMAGCASRQPPPPMPPHGAAVPFSESSADGQLPRGWRPYVKRPDKPLTRYETERDGEVTVLHASSDSASSGLQCVVDIDPGVTPWLRWRWRVNALHPEASVADDDTEDTPARIVVAFDGDKRRLTLRDRLFFEQVELFTGNVLPYATLTYVWDGQLPAGRMLPYFRTPRIQYLVAESGISGLGRWLSYERNVVADFQRAFGEPPPGRILSVGVLTDSDDLKNHVEAWYGDVGFFAAPRS